MPFLFDTRLAPLTFHWGFVRAPLAQVVRSYTRWQRLILHRVSAAPVTLPLEDALLRLLPLDTAASRILFQATRSEWTAMFSNHAWGATPSVAYLASRLRCRGLDCAAVPNTARRGSRGVWGMVQFTTHAADPGDRVYERTIRVANDVRGWDFFQRGVVQPFEEVDRYAARRVAERFTTEMLERYGRALGLELFDPAFYSGSGVMTRSVPWFLPPLESITLDEARARLGIDAPSE